MGSFRQTLAALACVLGATAAHATSSSVTVNDITYRLTDLVPDDGIDPSVVFDPSFQFYSEAQEASIFGSMDQAFMELRCFDCPLELGGVEIYKSDDANLAG